MDTTEIIKNALDWADKRLELADQKLTEEQRNYITFALRQNLVNILPIQNVSVRSSKVAYCRKYVDENGLCKRCGLDNYTHQKMVKDCEAYNAR